MTNKQQKSSKCQKHHKYETKTQQKRHKATKHNKKSTKKQQNVTNVIEIEQTFD